MNFESHAKKVATLKHLGKERNKKQIVQKRLQVTNTEMKMTSIDKVQFASLDEKKYYFSDATVSLPYGHPLQSKICLIKKSSKNFYNYQTRKKQLPIIRK